ncbi:hypothetical protein B0H14DRAFT_2783962 [Mycena olivaceomarginata]|nr:hypothetical protein B0H14DRAFT_2783962 [Mycena olivaceomarginata]
MRTPPLPSPRPSLGLSTLLLCQLRPAPARRRGWEKAREMRVCSRQIGGMAATPSDVAARQFEHTYEDVHRSDSAFAVCARGSAQ